MKKKLTAVIICLILTMSNTLLPVNAEGEDVEASGGTVETVEIKNAAELVAFAERVNAGATTLNAVLENDIDMSEITNFTPIGTSGKPYSGTFDGKEHEVQNLTTTSSSDYVGLFGYIQGATIKNVGVTGTGTIKTTKFYAGGIAGYAASGSTITNCYNEEAIEAYYAGGIAGQAYGTITNCYNKGKITASSDVAGGIAGQAYGTITNCYNEGEITASGNIGGGIAGRAYGTITNCYNKGKITVRGDNGGGIAGYAASGSTIKNCYNIAEVSTVNFGGGIAGYAASGSTIKNCYNIANVSTRSTGGGIAGQASGTITNCYYLADISITGSTTNSAGTSKIAEEFQSGAVAWLLYNGKSGDVWKQTLGEGGDDYPNFTGLTVGYYNKETGEYYNTAPGPAIASLSETADSITIVLNNYDESKYGKVKYTLASVDEEEWAAPASVTGNSFTIEGLDAGTTYTISLKYAGAGNIKETCKADITEVSVTTEKHKNLWTEQPDIEGWTYGKTGAAKGAAVYGTVEFTYYTDKDCQNPTTLENGGAEADGKQPVNAGTYYMIAVVEETNTYEGLKSGPIAFTIEKASQVAPSYLEGENETIDGKKDGKISGLTTDMEYAESEAAEGREYTKITDMDMTFAPGTYYIRYAGYENYKASDAVEVIIKAGEKLQVTVPREADQEGYTLKVTEHELRYGGETTLSFSLKDGYSCTGEFSITANGAALTKNNEGTYTISNVTENVEIRVTGVEDITEPDGTIELSDNKWKKFLNKITFGLFFKDTQTVSITGEDAGSGIADICYYISDEEISETDMKSSSFEWQNYENAFSINPERKYIIYAKLTDKAGNPTYISSEGIVIYKDAQQVTTELEYVKGQTGSDLTVQVELNGNTVSSIRMEGEEAGEIPISEDIYTVNGPDENGYSTITFDLEAFDSFFKEFTSGDYTLTIRYNPLGEEYQEKEEGGKDKNAAPAATEITLKIRDRLTYKVESPDLTYNGEAQELLKAEVNGGTISYSTDGVNWSAAIPAETDAGEYTVYYKIEADATHSGSIDSTEIKAAIGKQEITIPAAETGLIYTGKELTGVEQGTGYTLKGNTAIDAGNYIAEAEPDRNHQWKDSQTPDATVEINWTIGKADSTITITDDIGRAYDGNAVSNPVTEKTGSSASVSFQWYGRNSDGEYEPLDDAPASAGSYKVAAILEADGNYNRAETEKEFTISPKALTGDLISLSADSYPFTGETITPEIISDSLTAEDYSIHGETAALAYGTYTITVEGKNNYYGSVEAEWRITDPNAPAGTIEVSGSIWDAFPDTVTFGAFFREAQTVRITGEDGENESGVDTICYYLADTAMSEAEVKALSEAAWTELQTENGSGNFSVAPDRKLIIYARISDKAGNATYISSEGIVLDAAAPEITGVQDNQTYFTTQKVKISDAYLDTVTVNGEAVTLSDGELTLEGNTDTVYVIAAADKAGNSTEVTVTMKKTVAAGEEIGGLETDKVTSRDKSAVEESLERISELLKTENLTEDERSILEELRKEAEELLERIESVQAEIGEVTDIINRYENVTPEDRAAIQETLERIEALLNSSNITEEERSSLNEAKEKGELLVKKMNETDEEDTEEATEEATEGATEEATEVEAVGEKVDTGDNISLYLLYIILLLLSGGYIVVRQMNI